MAFLENFLSNANILKIEKRKQSSFYKNNLIFIPNIIFQEKIIFCQIFPRNLNAKI